MGRSRDFCPLFLALMLQARSGDAHLHMNSPYSSAVSSYTNVETALGSYFFCISIGRRRNDRYRDVVFQVSSNNGSDCRD